MSDSKSYPQVVVKMSKRLYIYRRVNNHDNKRFNDYERSE